MENYYSENLSGERLRRCYEIAPPRVRQYLEAEISYVLEQIDGKARILELGCGYGRVLWHLIPRAEWLVGIDISWDNIKLAQQTLPPGKCDLAVMDATKLGFARGVFDIVLCIQNGICAFGVDKRDLVTEAIRVAGQGGCLLFSTYSDRFWEHRLAWFELQSREGLVGPIDYEATRNGTIVCKDGFRAGRFTRADWTRLCELLGLRYKLVEVDESSLFCRISV